MGLLHYCIDMLHPDHPTWANREAASPTPRPRATSHYFTPQPLARDGATHAKALRHEAHWITARVAGSALELATGAGVFARSGLDAGSQLLLETATFAAAARVCDLGCGWGAVGCFVARRKPDAQVWMCDINLRAVALAHLNGQHNDLGNVTVWCGDGLDAMRAGVFDAILCNPPVRAGNGVMAKLFNDAQRCLAPEGTLWVVLRTAQGAKSWQRRLAEQFGSCETVAIAHGYRILKAVSSS